MLRVVFPFSMDRGKLLCSQTFYQLALHNHHIQFYAIAPEIATSAPSPLRFNADPRPIQPISPVALLRDRFDIIHQTAPAPQSWLATQMIKTRSFGHCVQILTVPTYPPAPPNKAFWQTLRSADVLTTTNEGIANALQQSWGHTVDAIIPMGVNLQFFSPQAAHPIDRRLYGIERPFVLFIGPLCDRARPDMLLAIAAEIPELYFVLVTTDGTCFAETANATGDEMDDLCYQDAIAAHPNVKWLGNQPLMEVRNLMAQAIALVIPAPSDDVPHPILEAAAMGLPVIVASHPPLPDVILDGITGWLLPVTLLSEWVDTLRTLAQWSVIERHHFALVARAFASEHYSWTRIAELYSDLYHRVARL